jgi:D-aspartate ligase
MTKKGQIGAVVVGGDHPGLAIARSLGRRGIPVVVIDDQYSISKFSKYVTRIERVSDLKDQRAAVDSVLEVGQRLGLKDWVLFPTRDENVAAFSIYRDRLAEFFRVTTAPWATVRWVWDKANTYQLAEKLGIPAPRTWNPKSVDDLSDLDAHLPLAIKPAVKENFFYATGAKAWRAETPKQLRELYLRACRDVDPCEILIQQIIPGDGLRQLSYCAFFRDGHAHSVMVARRMRQHPREFGRAATYVETVDLPELEELAERFLRAIDFNGIVEVEFKQDVRDGEYKLLDVNARAWGFHGLGLAAGVDFPYLLFADQCGMQVAPARGKSGLGWMRLLPDIPLVLSDLADGYLKLGAYWHSLKATRVESVFSWKDPLPSIAEFVLLPYFIKKKYGKRYEWETRSTRSPVVVGRLRSLTENDSGLN